MGRSDSLFHQSSETQRHLDPRSSILDGSDVEYAWSTDVTLISSLEQWRQCYCGTTK